jgi:hypothetical protein
MLTVSFDVSAFERKLERMSTTVEQFGSFEIPVGLSAWQREDMNRQYPNQEHPDNKTALTRIWPRSRASTVGRFHPKRAPTGRPRGRPKGVKTGQGRPVFRRTRMRLVKGAASRPILRPELFVKLCERMAMLMQDKIKWR